jgi:hypothetical protein
MTVPAMVDYDMFLPEVMPWARACAEPVAIQAIKNAAIEFCERSSWWKYETDNIPLVIDQADYVVPAPAGTDLACLLQAFYAGRQLFIRTSDDLANDSLVDWRSIQANQPSAVTQMSQDSVRINPVPNADVDPTMFLSLVVALKPSRDSTQVFQAVYEQFAETVAQGALARLYSQFATPYSNPQAMQVARAMFNSGVDDARAEVNRAYGRVGITVQIPRFI